MKKRAVYPGSFDPVTNGHLDMMRRGMKIFDQLVVAVLNNSNKKPLFTLEERITLLKQATAEMTNVVIMSFNGLLVDFMREQNIHIILRGLRAISDFEYELQIAETNNHLSDSVETCFMMADKTYSFLSSTIVKGISKYGGDVTELVPEASDLALKAKYGFASTSIR
ncbi:pantetheine-phosphate adenylyltransferase [Sporolactobacillus sp. KGMB 08714]|uniref:pantetheine-phosphate adenylyltransferase n=1 Tax=Sporolactobacillus sp. KGMB 08714 TaxID=3064704 RepID=UPI002FBED888